MLRASSACEAAGYPSSSLVCEGFMRQAGATSVGLGMPNIPLALVPGHIGTQSNAEIERNIIDVTVDRVIENLTAATAAKGDPTEPGARDIVFRGGLAAVNQYFVENDYSDGLPIIPPTQEGVEAFLRFTDRRPDEMLGVLLPDNRAATVWSTSSPPDMEGRDAQCADGVVWGTARAHISRRVFSETRQ